MFNLYYAYQDHKNIAVYFADQAKIICIEINPLLVH